MKQEKSKSEQRRIAIQKSEVSDAKEKKEILTATKNAFLPDGTFIAKGEKVEVSAEYAEAVRKANDKSFI